MKVQLIVTETKVVDTEVTLPHYYRHRIDLDSDCVVYGKIEENSASSIQIKRYGKNEEIQIEKEYYTSLAMSGLSSYFKDEYKSSQADYESAKEKALRLLNQYL